MVTEVNKITKQPVLIVWDNTQTFLKLDNHLVELQTKSVSQGLDLLFKVYHIFDLKYPEPVDYFFKFLESIYELSTTKLPILVELEQNIRKFQI
jgi:hypothetical protein